MSADGPFWSLYAEDQTDKNIIFASISLAIKGGIESFFQLFSDNRFDLNRA